MISSAKEFKEQTLYEVSSQFPKLPQILSCDRYPANFAPKNENLWLVLVTDEYASDSRKERSRKDEIDSAAKDRAYCFARSRPFLQLHRTAMTITGIS
ncbi:hypothetical protein PR202_ga03771 [Eleusine coracana subsp. coracana]|uniref:Uncharacterized protein n=1 Tax=Eleusine coracana subsp. coracana TaxID=191504 RepID=A0AAV5BNA5_ELECO|nr:hypothetical protein PR202_ga03771 [Eleusine coracana subsp. coracana]